MGFEQNGGENLIPGPDAVRLTRPRLAGKRDVVYELLALTQVMSEAQEMFLLVLSGPVSGVVMLSTFEVPYRSRMSKIKGHPCGYPVSK
jgi:hypothetical protein